MSIVNLHLTLPQGRQSGLKTDNWEGVSLVWDSLHGPSRIDAYAWP